ncbi:MAG: SWIM zinc finger family protein [Chloroflexia bacterium]|nr:SWIM zinc finger family protein [Chloroflexia bacterium]
MQLSAEQIATLAPDARAAAAGRKLESPDHWQKLGRNDAALWGECRGSALYHTRVSLADTATKCSCPSHKFPCKHALGLLFLAAHTPAAVPESPPPDWVAEWLTKRAEDATKRQTRADTPTTRSKRSSKREALVQQGLDSLDLWLADLMRNGLATVETQPVTFWERQAARMVDAQAPGIAARLKAIATIPHSSPDWSRRLLNALGRLALLIEAYRNQSALDPLSQEDVRQATGWTLTQEEVIERGQVIQDEWYCLGRHVTGDERLRTRFTHLLGRKTGRSALVLHFSPVGRPFTEETPLPGTRQCAEVAFWPSAYPQRALVRSTLATPSPITDTLPGAASIGAYLGEVARATGCQPWLDRFGCALLGVTPVRTDDGLWWVRDHEGYGLPLTSGEYWDALALSGGSPVDLAGEWDGEVLRPLGVRTDGAYYNIGEQR